MKKFNKKAIFAALMGALSSVSSFAMEDDKKVTVRKGRTIDNADLFQKYQDKRIMFLDKNDSNLNLTQDELEKIFKQMAEVEYISFGYGGIIKTRKKLEKNLEEFIKTKKIPARDDSIVSTLTLSKKNQTTISKEKNSQIEEIYNGLLEDYNRNDKLRKKYLLCKDKYGKNIDGYISFCTPFSRYPKKILIHCLANKKSGVGGHMIRYMQQKYEDLFLFPQNENAENFYKHMGFTDSHSHMGLEWKKLRTIK